MKYNICLRHGPHRCPICGRYVFSEYASYEYCPVCGWQDDPMQERKPDCCGVNEMSLNDTREEWLRESEPVIAANLQARAVSKEEAPDWEAFKAEVRQAYFNLHADADLAKGQMFYASEGFDKITKMVYASCLARFKAGLFTREDVLGTGIGDAIGTLFEIEDDIAPHPCPVCGQYYFSDYDSYELCPVCEWQDDAGQEADPDYADGANYCSLRQARREWRRTVFTHINANLAARAAAPETPPAYDAFCAAVRAGFYTLDGKEGMLVREKFFKSDKIQTILEMDYKRALAKYAAGVINSKEFLAAEARATLEIIVFMFKIRKKH